MIINCINCNKKFEVNSSLIPEKGRTIQCGTCDHTWFYTHRKEKFLDHSTNKSQEIKIDLLKENQKITEKTKSQNYEPVLQEKTSFSKENIKDSKVIKKKVNTKKDSFTFGKFLSYLLVLIISFIALIVVLDTFKTPLSNFFPDLELFLFNLFETIKDIYLFLKNLYI